MLDVEKFVGEQLGPGAYAYFKPVIVRVVKAALARDREEREAKSKKQIGILERAINRRDEIIDTWNKKWRKSIPADTLSADLARLVESPETQRWIWNKKEHQLECWTVVNDTQSPHAAVDAALKEIGSLTERGGR